jgi:hypothetical protein
MSLNPKLLSLKWYLYSTSTVSLIAAIDVAYRSSSFINVWEFLGINFKRIRFSVEKSALNDWMSRPLCSFALNAFIFPEVLTEL